MEGIQSISFRDRAKSLIERMKRVRREQRELWSRLRELRVRAKNFKDRE